MISIKNIIEYFYKIPVLKLLNKDDIYSFKYNLNEYIFIPTQRTELELTEIHNIIDKKILYDQLVQNIEKKYLTRTSKGYYILLKKSNNAKQIDLENMIIQSKLTPIWYENYQSIDRTNWIKMWTKKIDYIEYQLLHVENKYPIVSKSINYYIGMTETAISYLTNNLVNKNESNIVISHKRVVTDNFNNPMNIIVDHFARDVSEYLKYIFIKDEYNYSDIASFLNKCNLSEMDSKLVYARLMYPSHYFDLYDRIIDGKDKEKKILTLISRGAEYEKYIKNVYVILTKKYSNIFTTEWL